MYGWRLQKPLNGVVLRIPGVPRLLSRSTLRTSGFPTRLLHAGMGKRGKCFRQWFGVGRHGKCARLPS